MKISTVIQTHPGRQSHAKRLARATGGTLVTDPEPDGPRNPWRSYRACLTHPLGDATHRLILQDDALLCRRFTTAAGMAVSRAPSVPILFCITLYATHTTRAIWEAADVGASWALLTHDPWVPVVAACWPEWAVESILDYADRMHDGRPIADDGLLADWRQVSHSPILVTVPNLVDHDDLLPSIANPGGNTRSDRRSPCWIGEQCDPVPGIDWSSGLPSWAAS